MTRLQVPPTLERYAIPREVVTATAAFLELRGRSGLEGTVLWLGEVDTETKATVTKPYVPEQVAYRSAQGLAVEVTRRGLSGLIESLPLGVFVLVRVHSHGEHAYHSETDDQNMIVSHEGAISIVVPYFARHGLDLMECSVNELRRGRGWSQLTPEDVKRRFESR